MGRDLEEDMKNSPWFMAKIKEDYYAQNIYAALCNMRWQPQDIWPVLKNEYWHCSWRYAGGVVARLRTNEHYMYGYCSGMGEFATYNDEEGKQYMLEKKYVPEGIVTDEVAEDLSNLGWIASPWPEHE